MNYSVKNLELNSHPFKVNAFLFEPIKACKSNCYAIFTHGYTSHKGDILLWGQRLAECGVTTILFDLPGHYLGSFNEIHSFEEFKTYTHELFYKSLESLTIKKGDRLIVGGHSLGAFLALKSLNSPNYKNFNTICICVGLGLYEKSNNFVEKNNFFVEIIKERTMLVSKKIAPSIIMPWFNERINNLKTHNQSIFIINGEDDFVVQGIHSKALYDLLKSTNKVQLISPNSLPHHTPEKAIIFYMKASGF